MIALIDGDIVAYRCSASAENEPEDIAILRADLMMRDMLRDTDSTEYKCFLSGKNNFRYDIYPEYKANRKDKPKPVHLEACRQFLVKEWNAVISEGCEADDLIGIEATASDDMMGYVICSIDKDLKQLSGNHYNFVTKEKLFVSPLDGLKRFYKQLIMGDVSDNVMGFDGKARQKPPKFLEGHLAYIDDCSDEYDMYQYVYDLYIDQDTLDLNAKLLFMLRKEGVLWTPPTKEMHGEAEESNSDPVQE